MTEKQQHALLLRALRSLRKTSQGHVQWEKEGRTGPHWKAAMRDLARLERDLKTVVPELGPVWRGGKSVLLHDLTHRTTGIPLYPAFDDAFRQGEVIIAPEAIEVCKRETGANPGEAFFACGRSKVDYWFGHLDRSHPLGTNFAKGDAVGKVAQNTIGGGPHVHVGINVERLLGEGKQLIHHTDYTHGGPTVGAQLAKAES